jgi:hypothetical protein
MADIVDSVAELRYYREKVFVAGEASSPPSPTQSKDS